jgi:hypothetical protein
MKILNLSLLFLITSMISFSTFAQDLKKHNWTPLKYEANESPFAFAGGFGIGPTSRVLGVATSLDFDIYHILLSVRVLRHPFGVERHQDLSDLGGLIGYQFRNGKFLASAAYGLAYHRYWCTSGIGGNCSGRGIDEYSAFAYKFDGTYAFSSRAATGITVHYTTSSREKVTSVMVCIKLGYFRSGPHNKLR